MSDWVCFRLGYQSCSYCNKKFYYNGATMVDYEKTLKEKNAHESVCLKRESKMIESEIDEVFIELKKLLINKNMDYGDSFNLLYKKFGLLSVIIRLSDKVTRLEKLNDDKLKIKNESIEDTLKDMIGYCILGLIELHEK